MGLTRFDQENIGEILNGEGDWYTAHVLRFLDKVVFKADKSNLATLLTMWPEEVKAIYRFNGWPEDEIEEQFKYLEVHVV